MSFILTTSLTKKKKKINPRRNFNSFLFDGTSAAPRRRTGTSPVTSSHSVLLSVLDFSRPPSGSQAKSPQTELLLPPGSKNMPFTLQSSLPGMCTCPYLIDHRCALCRCLMPYSKSWARFNPSAGVLHVVTPLQQCNFNGFFKINEAAVFFHALL